MKKADNCGGLIFPLILLVCVMALVPTLTMGQTSNQTTPTTTTRLRMVIPVRDIMSGFVDIEHDPITGDSNFSGFAIEAFKAVVNTALPYSLSYELIPFAKPDGTMNGTFDDMLKAVFSQEYDGALGDISLLHYRTEWVDFTVPYMDTGISMLVPLRQQSSHSQSGGISLAKVTKGIVATALGFSLLFGLVFWVMEHKYDKQASQPQPPRFDDDHWRRELLGSIIQTRLVVVLLFMVLIILTACYTASQTSSLTSPNRKIPVRNLNQLIRKKENVGYATGSFIYNLLLQKGFPESRLIAFHSEQEMLDMLTKGTANGGVAAVVAVTPFLKLFLAKHCDAFTIVPTVNLLTAGFGFAFRKGSSSIVRDFSNGILKVTDSGQLARIKDRTIGSLEACEDDPNAVAASNLRIDSEALWILIAGAIGVFVLMIIILLLYCGGRCSTRKKKAVAYPCYLLPCC